MKKPQVKQWAAVLTGFFVGMPGVALAQTTQLAESAMVTIIEFLLGTVALVSTIMVVFTTIYFLTTGGDEGRLETCVRMTWWTIGGLVFSFVSFAILRVFIGQ